jgi:hypothetical protein
MDIITSGRNDLNDFFDNLNPNEKFSYSHTPFLVFNCSDNTVKVDIVRKRVDLERYGDDTKVMKQWGGEYRSDFFHFTLGQMREYFDESLKELKKEVMLLDELSVTIGYGGKIYSFNYKGEGRGYYNYSDKDFINTALRFNPKVVTIEQYRRGSNSKVKYTGDKWNEMSHKSDIR